jgi:hypothetical protein
MGDRLRGIARRLSLANIVSGSLAITAIDDLDIVPIPAQSMPSVIGDFDNDGIPDLMIKFDRSRLQQARQE